MSGLVGAANYLGIDAGGTNLRWTCLDAAGALVADGRGPGVQPAVQGIEPAARALAGLLIELDAKYAPRAIVAGLAGVGAADVRAKFRAALQAAGVRDLSHFTLCGDPQVAAATALSDAAGVAAWSGTGSFVIARAPGDGALLRLGGRGYLLGDGGSGFSIVRAAAVVAVEAADGVGPAAPGLSARLCEAFGVARAEDLGGRLQALRSGEVAAMVGVVFEAASAGDVAAERVLDVEAGRLASLVREVARRAGLPPSPCHVGGGVLRRSAAMREKLAAALTAQGVAAAVEVVHTCESVGAARLARAVDRFESPLAEWVR